MDHSGTGPHSGRASRWRLVFAPRVLDVFTADGKYRGTVELDGLYQPMAVTPDRVYGVLYDELGVEFLVAYSVDESGAPN